MTAPAPRAGKATARWTGSGSPLRYAAAGLVNTAAGYLGIVLAAALGAAPIAANAIGFGVGFLVSLEVARRWTFASERQDGSATGRRDGRDRGVRARYAACFLSCWALNVLVLRTGLALGAPDWLAQGLGVGAYAVSFYLAARVLVFGQGAALARDLRALRGLLRDRGSAGARGPRSQPAPSRPSS